MKPLSTAWAIHALSTSFFLEFHYTLLTMAIVFDSMFLQLLPPIINKLQTKFITQDLYVRAESGDDTRFRQPLGV